MLLNPLVLSFPTQSLLWGNQRPKKATYEGQTGCGMRQLFPWLLDLTWPCFFCWRRERLALMTFLDHDRTRPKGMDLPVIYMLSFNSESLKSSVSTRIQAWRQEMQVLKKDNGTPMTVKSQASCVNDPALGHHSAFHDGNKNRYITETKRRSAIEASGT